MEQDESGRQTLAEQQDRIGHRIAEHMESNAQEHTPKGPGASNAEAGDSNPPAQSEREGDNDSGSPRGESSKGEAEETKPSVPQTDSSEMDTEMEGEPPHVCAPVEADEGESGSRRERSAVDSTSRDRSRSPRGSEVVTREPACPEDEAMEQAPEMTAEATGTKREAAPAIQHDSKKPKPDEWWRTADLSTLAAEDIYNLSTHWDFTDANQRNTALAHIRERKPKLVIAGTMCRRRDEAQWRESSRHNQFVSQLYRAQRDEGSWFLHVQPATATRSCAEEVRQMMQELRGHYISAGNCMHLLEVPSQNGCSKGRTSFYTNSDAICKALRTRSVDTVQEVVRNALDVEAQLQARGLQKLVTVGPGTRVSAAPPEEEQEEWRQAWDDVTGKELSPSAVAAARAKELEYVRKKQVWQAIPRAEAQRRGMKVINTRWVDINKGDTANPNYRSRFVAKEFNTGPGDGLFAATPPLEAVRLLLSDAATRQQEEEGEANVVMINDVARAFFEAPVRREVCVELPPEERREGEDMVGFLKQSLYGTRDAAANFQREVRKFLVGAGFVQSAYSPSVFYHISRNIKTLVHGDDFLTTAKRSDAQWFKEMLERRFEIKTVVVGPGEGEVPEGRILGRIIRAAQDGSWEYEADPRHAELIIEDLQLQSAKGVQTPGEEEKPWEHDELSEALPPAEATQYRALAARANYLAQDRADLQFAAKEICRGMSQPTKGHQKRLKRLARYLVQCPRVVWQFNVQRNTEDIRAYSDSDWAGCRRTARSTSGGAIMRGTHCLRTWSVTQKFVTLSSGEAELMALVKAASEAIGMAQLAMGWGLHLEISVHVDSTAALAVAARKGNGKLRHVRIGHLWVQELAEAEAVAFRKVRGTENPADLMTKYLPVGKASPLATALAQFAREGHAATRLGLNSFRAKSLEPPAGEGQEGKDGTMRPRPRPHRAAVTTLEP